MSSQFSSHFVFRMIASTLTLVTVGCATSIPTSTSHNETSIVEKENLHDRAPAGYTVQSFPILEALQAQGQPLAQETLDWMKKWKGIDLEDKSLYQFKELSGSTSINLKIRKIDPSDEKGYKSRGSFVTRNSAANPNTELAYFNLAAIFGFDHAARPAVRYELGPIATQEFKSLILKANIKGNHRLQNKEKILAAIASGKPLKGVLKAKSPDTVMALETIANPRGGPNGGPQVAHPVIKFLQAQNPQPESGKQLILHRNYSGDALELSREYSVLMTLDSIFQQWDRYSGGNVEIQKDAEGKAHFYYGDNGGADLTSSTSWVVRNLNNFSRYDRKTVEKLKEIYDFLENPSKGFLGYNNAENFIVDLGLYYDNQPSVYIDRLKRNIKLFLDRVRSVEEKYGNATYFEVQ